MLMKEIETDQIKTTTHMQLFDTPNWQSMNYDTQVFGQVLFRPINCPYPHKPKIIRFMILNLSFSISHSLFLSVPLSHRVYMCSGLSRSSRSWLKDTMNCVLSMERMCDYEHGSDK